MLNFTKMNGAGNDFVLLDNRSSELRLTTESIARICDRHRGIGADGVLVVEPAANGADFRMRYYNSDGGEAEMCGNGARCFARFTRKLGWKRDEVSFETLAGTIRAHFEGDLVRLEMSEPKGLALNESIEGLIVHAINTGVPHAVILTDDLDRIDVAATGAMIRHHAHFAPKGTNVNFVQRLEADAAAVRTYERGVEAETLACGTGVVASALIFHELTGAKSPVKISVRGGDVLEVGFTQDEPASGAFKNVTLTGPAELVFDGQIDGAD
jgi:diaminopimelate epimerase